MIVTISLLIGIFVILLWVIGGRVARLVYLSSKIQGPSLWELATVHAKHLLTDNLSDYLWKLSESYDFKPFKLWFYENFVVVVSDCETMSEIYKKRETNDKPGVFYSAIAGVLGNNVLTTNGEKHRKTRKILNPAFRKNVIESHLDRINLEVSKFVNQLGNRANGDVIDIRPMIEDLLCALTLSTFSSGRIEYERMKYMFRSFESIMKEIHLRSVNPFYFWLVHKLKKSTRDHDTNIGKIFAHGRDIFLDQRERASQRMDDYGIKKPMDLLDALASSPYFEEEGFSEFKLIIGAGFDTTSFVLNVTLLFLAMHPEVQEEIYQEIQSAFGHDDRCLTVEDLAKLNYLEMAVKESLRLYPPAPLLLKKAEKETDLNGMIVPKGSILVLNLVAMHRNPNNFRDPLKYNPSRFAPEFSKGRHPFAFVPFSAGSRNCPGQYMAMMMLKLILCRVVKDFEITLGKKLETVEDIKTLMTFTLHLQESSLCFKRRSVS